MAIGDDALAAGMDVVPGTDDIRDSYLEITKSRDYITGGPNFWLPGLVIDGAKKTAARNALGVISSELTVQTNGAYDVGLIFDGVNLQLFINGVFHSYVDLNPTGGS